MQRKLSQGHVFYSVETADSSFRPYPDIQAKLSGKSETHRVTVKSREGKKIKEFQDTDLRTN